MSVGIHTSKGFVKVAGVGMGASPMAGATENKDGAAGLVPAPAIADREKFLRGDGNWVEINVESVDVPTTLAELTDDADHRTVTDEEKNTWNQKSDFSGNYGDLVGAPAIPTKVSELENDKNYLVEETDPTVPAWAKEPTKPTYTFDEVGAEKEGTASGAVSAHNADAEAHNDIRELIDTLQTEATTSVKGLMSSNDKAKLDNTNTAYGTCSTAAATAAKVVTISGNTNWVLKAGSRITVKFSETNTAQNPTLNVNSTGAKNIWYNTALITTTYLSYAGTANRPIEFVYDGTQYVFIGWSSNTTYSNQSLGNGYGTCTTGASTAAKVVTLTNYALVTNGFVSVKFTNAVPASATMNINGKGAKAIYYKGVAITANVINAGDTATFVYNGSQYHLIAIDRVASSSGTTISSTEPTNPTSGQVWIA